MSCSAIHVTDHQLSTIKSILAATLSDERVFVFGSRARGTHRQTSDIDLAIEGAGPLSMAIRAKLELDFSESSLPFRVDVVDLATVDKNFREIIGKQGVSLKYHSR